MRSARTTPTVDRLIVHKFDPLVTAPGGIDTCIRGLIRYAPAELRLGLIGVAGTPDARSRVGRWERHTLRGREIDFLPVAALDPGVQARRVPHAVRLVTGVLRYRGRIPASAVVQTHRTDVALAARILFRGRRQVMYLHTQKSGIIGETSDSFWRRAGAVQTAVEMAACKRADELYVFNEPYANALREVNSAAKFSPTWWDPELVQDRAGQTSSDEHTVLWVGRMERPKNPFLAIDVFARALDQDPDRKWQLRMVGGGTLLDETRAYLAAKPSSVRERVTLTGRQAPQEVMAEMAQASTFLMTSSPGYEGYPRSLVESLASGCTAVVTDGADTGRLVRDGSNGFRCGYEANDLGQALVRAVSLSADDARASVAHLGAPAIVSELFADRT